MKNVDLLRRQPVRYALLGAALIGAFVFGKCSISDPSEQEEQIVEKEEQIVEKKEIYFDDQCRDVRPDTQCSVSFLFLSEDGWSLIIYGESEEQEFSPPSFVLLKPLGKKRRFEKQESSPSSFVLLKPIRKKRRIAPLKKIAQEYVPRIFDEDIPYACKGNLIPALLATVTNLEARSILYGIGPLSDCSGILHRVLMGMKKRCPGHEYPSLSLYRDSRDIARWYHEQGELILIKNAVAQSDLIRPGMVLFYGRTGVKYKNASVKTLLSSRHGINHVGVVVRIYKDRRKKVAGYELFHGHGRRGRTKASVTSWHKLRPTRASYPPFGNGRQQLVAVARIVSVKKALEVVDQ